jgi:hypothetical protein
VKSKTQIERHLGFSITDGEWQAIAQAVERLQSQLDGPPTFGVLGVSLVPSDAIQSEDKASLDSSFAA